MNVNFEKSPMAAWEDPPDSPTTPLPLPVGQQDTPLLEKATPRDQAAQWLTELLQEPRLALELKQLAREAGISLSTLKRAKKSLGVRSTKRGGYFGGDDPRWYWRLD